METTGNIRQVEITDNNPSYLSQTT